MIRITFAAPGFWILEYQLVFTDDFIRDVHPGIGTIHSIMLHLHRISVKLESSGMTSERKLFQYVYMTFSAIVTIVMFVLVSSTGAVDGSVPSCQWQFSTGELEKFDGRSG